MKQPAHRGGTGNFANNPERAREAGRAGGSASGGNFRNDPARAVEAGVRLENGNYPTLRLFFVQSGIDCT